MHIKLRKLFLLSFIALQCVNCSSKNNDKELHGKWEQSLTDVTKRDISQSSKNNSAINEPPKSATLKEIAEVHKHMFKFWIVPCACMGTSDCSVKLRLKIDRNGNLIESCIVEKEKMNDVVYKALAESALRAVRDPRFSPLPFNLEHYEVWKEIIFTFDPKYMC